jgi:hypothetical protein
LAERKTPREKAACGTAGEGNRKERRGRYTTLLTRVASEHGHDPNEREQKGLFLPGSSNRYRILGIWAAGFPGGAAPGTNLGVPAYQTTDNLQSLL